MSTAVLGIVDALNTGAGNLAAAREHALRVVDDALALGCTVADDATVTAPAATPGSAVVIALGGDTALAQEVFNRDAQARAADLSRALDAVTAADTRLADALNKSLQALTAAAQSPPGTGTLSAQVQAITSGTAQLPTDPVQLKQFWDTLSPADKDALYNYDHNLGNHDGIPVTDRDHYNRQHILELQAQAKSRLDYIRSQHPDWVNRDHVPTTKDGESQYSAQDFTDWYREYSAADTEVQGYAAVAQGISEGPTSQPPKYLMGLDNQGRGIIATGNPDTARNVATFVPGTGSKLSGIGGDLRRSKAMLGAATAAGEPSTAVVTWYGYNAPPYLESATQGRYADAGAPDLTRFQDGLRATHDGPRSHNVVVGHSYGTTVIGDAAIRGRSLNADDVVFIASPGTMTNRASDLSLTGIDPSQNGSHVFTTKAENDPVPVFANTDAFGNDPRQLGIRRPHLRVRAR